MPNSLGFNEFGKAESGVGESEKADNINRWVRSERACAKLGSVKLPEAGVTSASE